jgi:hypothetical protein
MENMALYIWLFLIVLIPILFIAGFVCVGIYWIRNWKEVAFNREVTRQEIEKTKQLELESTKSSSKKGVLS